MKKVFFLLLLPFVLKAQDTTGTKRNNIIEDNKSLGNNSKEESREKIESLRQRVLNGESMSTLAALYTEDPGSAKTGGLYINVARGQFVPEFESAAFNLTPGSISEVFETQYGFHFVQLVARHGDTIDVRHILIRIK